VTLTNNGQILNLGLVPYDETLPEVDLVTPTNGTAGVPITNSVYLYFNKALNTNTVNAGGFLIIGTNGTVASAATPLADTNGDLSIVEITPKAPLQSLETYQVVVLAGDLFGAGGSLVGSGPEDLVGREMAAPFSSTFTTADNTPPQLLSMFPSNNAVQIDPSSVPRLVFNKTLNSTSFVFTVTGPNGLVPGTPELAGQRDLYDDGQQCLGPCGQLRGWSAIHCHLRNVGYNRSDHRDALDRQQYSTDGGRAGAGAGGARRHRTQCQRAFQPGL
jgi:hypothetical protein